MGPFDWTGRVVGKSLTLRCCSGEQGEAKGGTAKAAFEDREYIAGPGHKTLQIMGELSKNTYLFLRI